MLSAQVLVITLFQIYVWSQGVNLIFSNLTFFPVKWYFGCGMEKEREDR